MEKKKIEEFLERAKRAGNPEEVEAAAKACGLELTAEKLAKLDGALRGAKGELTDEALDGVVGGAVDPRTLKQGSPEYWAYIDEQIKKYGPGIVPALESIWK